jgi:hypothetical protein
VVGVKKKEIPVHVKILITLISAFALLSLIFGGVLIYDNLIYKEPKQGAVLEVEEVYFVYEGHSDVEYTVSVKAFISNVGDEDCDVRIRAFAVDDRSNLAMDDAETDVGVIKYDTTVETSFDITVIYAGTFTVELMIFKDDLIAVKGYGKVSLSEQKMGGRDYSDTVFDETRGEEAKEVPFPSPGIVAVSVLAGALVFGGLMKRRWRR